MVVFAIVIPSDDVLVPIIVDAATDECFSSMYEYRTGKYVLDCVVIGFVGGMVDAGALVMIIEDAARGLRS